MRLRSLYLTINLLALAILSGGLYVLWQEKQKSLIQDKNFSNEKLNSTLTFIKTINSLESYLDESSLSQAEIYKRLVIKGLTQYRSSLPHEFKASQLSKEIEEDLQTIENLRKKVIDLNASSKKTETSFISYRKKVEEALALKAKRIMMNQKELAPELENTLGSWSSTFPFLENIRKKVDLTYLKDEDVTTLNKVLKVSQWFSRELLKKGSLKTLKSTDLNAFKAETIKRLDLIHNTSVQTPGTIEVLYIKKDLEGMFSFWQKQTAFQESLAKTREDLKAVITSVREGEEKQLINLWQNSYLVKTEQKSIQKSKHYQLIMNSSFLVVGIIIIFSLFIFLKIFPHLKELERKADTMAQGDFSPSFTKIPNNEIGTLMTSFNSMASQLREYLDRISREEKEKARLAQSVQEMRHLSEMGEAATKIAHDLKNPISILQFCLKDIQANLSSVPDSSLTQEIVPDIERSLVAVDKLKLASDKLSTGRKKEASEEVSVKSILEDTITLFEARLEGQRITHQLVFNIEEERTLTLPRLELIGALSNLIVNAIEYYESSDTHEQAEIILSAEVKNNKTRITVANRGEEIQNANEIFNNFYSSKAGPLRGLGLSIVEDFMRDCKGSIRYEHENGFNCFRLTFS